MNVAEYRRELGVAHEEYRDAVRDASDRLMKRLAVAHEEFLGENENEKAVAARDVFRDRD